MKAPCKDCRDRHIGCHGRCEKYQEFSRNRFEYLAARNKDDMILDTAIIREKRRRFNSKGFNPGNGRNQK